MIDLSDQKRVEYEPYQPVFWRPANDAKAKHKPFIEYPIGRDNVIALVLDDSGTIDEFGIAANHVGAAGVQSGGSSLPHR